MSSPDRFADLKRFEGVVPHLYKDTKGVITAGVGFALRSVREAQLLSWDLPGQVRLDWIEVSAAPAGKLPAFYAKITRARLSMDAMDRELVKRVGGLPTWALALPAPAQLALQDIKYNTGNVDADKWPKMVAAIRAGDWATAARESRRPDVSKERNAWTAAQLRAAGGMP